MKNLIIILSLTLLTINLTNISYLKTNNISTEITITSDYCKGWNSGYCEGWKDVKGEYAICPVIPVCPIAKPGLTSYKDGYNRGFKAGRSKAKTSQL